MNTPILVTGGTGTLGSHVVRRLLDAGNEVRVLSRTARDPDSRVEYVMGDLDTGAGVDDAVAGVQTVVHCAGAQKGDDVKAQTLGRAAANAGVGHLVYISVVGADRVPVVSGIDRAMFGYFASKLGGERAVTESGVPWTTLRATQFHELFVMVARAMAKLPVIPAPAGFRFQPVAGDEVAARLVELALSEPAGLVPDIAGPTIYTFAELVRGYLRAVGKRRPMLPMPMPGRAARALRSGANLSPQRAVGRRTWEGFVAGAAVSMTPAVSTG